MSEETPATGAGPRRWVVMLPLVIFVVLAGVFLLQLMSGRDTSIVPSVLIGQPAPKTELPPLEGTNLPGLSTEAMKGRLTLVNVWASWCVPCRQENPILMELAKDSRFDLVGFNYKDKPANALKFLKDLGNPFEAIGTDQSGRAAIDWGVYGVPETYLVAPDGTILWKHVGPFTPQDVPERLNPQIEKALAGNS